MLIPKAIIFDVDGTFYNYQRLKRKMFGEMLTSIMIRPRKLKDIYMLQRFRKMREELTPSADLHARQYLEVAGALGVSPQIIERIVDEWLLSRPLKHLPSCGFPVIASLAGQLKQNGVKTGVFSDYPARAKLEALGISVDVIVSATDKDVGALKPDPNGLRVAAEKLGTPVGDCLFIGDRDDKDGQCARNAGMPYLKLDAKKLSKIGVFEEFCKRVEEWQR